MTAPAPGTSARLLIVGGASAGVGLLIHLVLPLTYGSLDTSSYDDEPWETKRFGFAVTRFLGTSISGGGVGLADLAVILGAVAIALAVAVRGFEPRIPRPVAPQGYPQGPYPGQYAQPQPGQAPGQFGQPGPAPTGQPGQPGPAPTGQPGQPVPPDQGGYPQQQQWGGPAS